MADPPSLPAAAAANYDTIIKKLATFPPPLLPPGHVYNKQTTADIAALQVHPSLEAALHILNHDLPSAHFLVRHMEAPPAVEGMTCHAILHRIEGDYDNARAWYKDIASNTDGLGLLERSWGSNAEDEVLKFVDQVEDMNKHKHGDKRELAEKSLKEIMNVIKQCEERVGSGRWEDASQAWTKSPEKNQKMKESMTTGGEGYRKF